MTLSAAPENDSDFRPSLARYLSQIQIMSLNALRISLADNVQLSLQAWFTQRPAIRHPYHDLKGRQQAQKTLQWPGAFTEDVRHNRPPYPVIRVKQPALTWFSTDVAPMFVHFSADNHHFPVVCARLPTAAWVFKWRKNRVEANAHNACTGATSAWPYQWFSGVPAERRCEL